MMKRFITLLTLTILTIGSGFGQTVCSQAPSLNCNQSYTSSTKSASNSFNSNSYADCYNGNSSFNGRDAVYKVNVPSGNTLTVDLWNLTGDVDLFVFSACDGAELYDCKGSSLNSNNTSEKVTVNNASGIYYIVVDAYTSSILADFYLRASCVPSTSESPCNGSSNPEISSYVSEELTCGDRVTGSNHSSGNNYNTYNCFDGTFVGNDVFYEVYFPQTTNVSISLTGLSADLDLFLISCSNGSTNCLAASTGPNGSNEQINVNNASGYFYVIIDAQYASSLSSFILDIDCGGDDLTCSDAEALVCGRTYNKTTFQSGNHFEYNDLGGCANGITQSTNPFTGNDRLFRIDVPSQSNLTISMTGLSADLDMFLFDQCQTYSSNPADLTTCIARSINGSNQSEQLSVANASGTYYLLVDGHDEAEASNFTINIDCEDCEDTRDANCNSMSYSYLNNSDGFLYNFSVASSLPASGVWTIQRVGNSQISTSTGGRSSNVRFGSAGTYIVCYAYVKSDGCTGSCCKTVYISNPYDCDDIFYSYNQNANSYTLNIPGISSATWYDDDNNTVIGTGTTVNVAVTGTCRVRNFSVRFYDSNLNAYRVCCISLYMCDPYDCNDITYGYNQNSNSYVLSIPGINNATWYDDDNNTTIGSGSTVNVAVTGSCRVRNFSVRFFDPAVNAYRICCINIYMCNPYDCNDITYGYNQNSNSYVLSIPGINNATWYDDDNNTTIGSGSTVNVAVTGSCRVRNFSVRFYDPAVNAYRICCINIYMCNPYDCNNITYGYNQNTNSYALNIPGISNATWYDDDNNTVIGSGTTVNVPVSGSCRTRNFSVRFYDPAVDAYRICCIRIYICDPYDCNSLQKIYNPNNNIWSISLPGLSSANVLYWQDDATGQQIAGSTSNITLNNPSAGNCRYISVHYFDPSSNCYRVCCLQICKDPNDCTGTPSDNECSGGNVVEETPVCGCDEQTYASACEALAAGVQSWTTGECPPSTNPNCDEVTFRYVSTLRYSFSVPNSFPSGSWTAQRGSGGVVGIGSGRNITYTFSQAGVYTICYRYLENGVSKQCCKTINIAGNPYDCNDIVYGYNASTGRYDLSIPGVSDANVLYWQDDDNNTVIGSGSTVSITIAANCRVRNFSVVFYDAAINAYRICCIRIYICNPYDCNSITYSYNNTNNSYLLSIPGVNNATWYDDDNNTTIGSGTNVSVAVGSGCGLRNFSVRFFDPAVNAYRICCISIYICNPYNCDSIIDSYNAGSNTYTLTLPGVPSAQVLMWRNDDTGQQIAGSTNTISINNPASGNCVAISVLFYDPAINGYRICCIEVCNNTPDACAGITNERLTCKDDGSYDYTFTLVNNSGRTVDAAFSMVSPIGITFNNCTLKREIFNIGTSRTITLNIDNCLVSLNPGTQIVYELTLQESGKDEGWCCHLDPITITMPECEDICEGTAQPDMICTAIYEPVCGCNGLTYSNQCYAARAGVQSIVSGPCTGDACETIENLVKNGDFEGGNWAFTNSYGSGCYCGDNTYCIRDNARNKCNSWNATTGDGKFLIIEGAAGGATKSAWKQTVAVQSGLDYNFYFDYYPNLTAGSQPILEFYIGGNRIGSAIQGFTNQWRTYNVNWTASATTFVEIEIRKVGSNGGTNDFGIDNVRFEFCLDGLNITPEVDEALTLKTSGDTELIAAPNPFTDVTTISFTLESDTPAVLSIFNMDGKQIFFQEGNFHEGINTLEFKADASLSAGIYYYRLETAAQTVTKSMILMK